MIVFHGMGLEARDERFSGELTPDRHLFTTLDYEAAMLYAKGDSSQVWEFDLPFADNDENFIDIFSGDARRTEEEWAEILNLDDDAYELVLSDDCFPYGNSEASWHQVLGDNCDAREYSEDRERKIIQAIARNNPGVVGITYNETLVYGKRSQLSASYRVVLVFDQADLEDPRIAEDSEE